MLNEETDEKRKSKDLKNVLETARVLEKTIIFTREYEQFWLISSQWKKLEQIITSAHSAVVLTVVTVECAIPPDLEFYSDPIIVKVFTTLFENSVRHGGNSMTEIRISPQSRIWIW